MMCLFAAFLLDFPQVRKGQKNSDKSELKCVFSVLRKYTLPYLHSEYSLMKATLGVIVYMGEVEAGAISPKRIVN